MTKGIKLGKNKSGWWLVGMALFGLVEAVQAANVNYGLFPTGFTWKDSIRNTPHNLTLDTRIPTTYTATMAGARNNYGEVCVYCHTPHGANNGGTAAPAPGKMPLWNRTRRLNTYQTYDQNNTTTKHEAYSPPGANSLTCLSCHDGTTAVDSILNMPSRQYNATNGGIATASYNANRGGYNAIMATAPGAQTAVPIGGGNTRITGRLAANTFLNSWDNRVGESNTTNHSGFNVASLGNNDTFGDGNGTVGCLACHLDPNTRSNFIPGDGLPYFDAFLIGTDLRNDHPVGMTFPLGTTGIATEFNQPMGNARGTRFFDLNTNSFMDKNEIRAYDSGQGPEVECASCHDPHGVQNPTAPIAGTFYRSFLRVNQDSSGVCLTCHIK